jgi:ATP-dependent protease ClpP protease subunit
VRNMVEGDELQFVLSGYLDDEVVGNFIEAMQVSDSLDPTLPWRILFNSEGGNVEAGSALYDAIRLYSEWGGGTHHITIVTIGQCASMATLVVQAADWRCSTPLTVWMFHDASAEFENKEIRSIREELDALQEWSDIADILTIRRSKLSMDQYREKVTGRNWWTNAHELLDLGFIDEVL